MFVKSQTRSRLCSSIHFHPLKLVSHAHLKNNMNFTNFLHITIECLFEKNGWNFSTVQPSRIVLKYSGKMNMIFSSHFIPKILEML